MPKSRRRWLVLGGLAVVLVVGAGAGIAATGGAGDGFLADVARRLGISEQKLTDAIRDAQIAQIDAAVKAGDLTEEQGERLKERVRSGEGRGLVPGFGLGPGFRDFGPDRDFGPLPFGRGPFRAGVDMLDAAADYLGVTQAELREALRDEQSLADVARAKGKSVDGLKAAMIKGVKADLDEAVEDGDITREHADQLVEKLSGEIDRLVEGRVPSPRPFGRGFGFGFGFGGGGDLFEAAADYLGLTEAQLRDELSDGDSLEDVAKAKGKSVDGLKTAMRSALKAELDEEVEEGDITREQANELLDDLSDVIDEAIAGDFRGFGFHMKFRGGPGAGFDFEFGVRPDAGFPDILPAPEPAFDIEVEKLQTF